MFSYKNVFYFSPDNLYFKFLSTQDDEGNVTDMVSFYTLPSTVVDHPKHKTLKAAYSFYNVASRAKLSELMNDALVVAKNVCTTICFSLNITPGAVMLK